MAFNENTRVQIPALIHLTRLGYKYFSLKDDSFSFDKDTNIIKSIFKEQFFRLNELDEKSDKDIAIFEREFKNIQIELGEDNLGRNFYKRLVGLANSKYKIINWDNFNKNDFHICSELTCKNGEDEFRPDIIVFINGLPLSFIEVKKPNNHEGIKAERDRINSRFKNEKFRKFINITQLLVFSNNMKYDDVGQDQLQGAFYATTARNSDIKFNNFREELRHELPELLPISENIENEILKDHNKQVLKFAPEFVTNKNESTPTNNILTSLYTKERLKIILQYGIVYVDEIIDGKEVLQKHILRYPQFFALKAIQKKLDSGINKGVIWHTQGSGKTALAYYSVKYLKDYYSKKGVVPKFYFIVDRLDLLKQAKDEFTKRGLDVATVSNKDELQTEFKSTSATKDITVINIQKFKEDTTAFNNSGYNLNIQRIYFIDEAHRSYDPKGSSLANLYNSDQNSIKIALTGTPLIVYKERKPVEEFDEELSSKEDVKTTRNIFGEYIHKYYYNKSIQDGYTLKLLREEIETSYKEKMREVVRNVERELKVKLGTLDKRELKAHPKFVMPMLDYLLTDFTNSRIRFGDKTIGAMVVCDSSEQARELFKQFEENKATHNLRSALILHDENDKTTREQQIKDFKDGKIDFLFVYSMLLTGFDAPRLKKLYLGRKIKAHNLLQTLTRVNRPYKGFRIGYVVDFADISAEFDITNKAYFDELNREYDITTTGEENVFGSLFMSKEEIDGALRKSENVLIDYSTDNKEMFRLQVDELGKDKLLELKKALEQIRELYNIARLLGHTEVLEKVDFKLISQLLTMVSDRLALVNAQAALTDINSKEMLNLAIEDVVFNFTKVDEEELRMLANDLQDKAYKIRSTLRELNEQKDPEWLSLYEEFRELLKKHDITQNDFTKETATFVSNELDSIWKRVAELNRKYSVLRVKFNDDVKYARIFKTLEPSGVISNKVWLFEILQVIKQSIDSQVGINEKMLSNRAFFQKLVTQLIVEVFETYSGQIDSSILINLSTMTANEYFYERQATA
jgi:type I restriction enzyme R subunit